MLFPEQKYWFHESMIKMDLSYFFFIFLYFSSYFYLLIQKYWVSTMCQSVKVDNTCLYKKERVSLTSWKPLPSEGDKFMHQYIQHSTFSARGVWVQWPGCFMKKMLTYASGIIVNRIIDTNQWTKW